MKNGMAKVIIHKERCKCCQLCIAFCPKKIIITTNETNAAGYHFVRVSDDGKCTGCAICARMCPDVAIEVYKE